MGVAGRHLFGASLQEMSRTHDNTSGTGERRGGGEGRG